MARRDHCRFVKNPRDLAPLIDHTLLKPVATKQDIIRLCEEAAKYGFASVCVNPYWVPLAAENLENSSTLVCTVIGFPLGSNMSIVKAEETRICIESGANEIDMVINIGQVKAHNWREVFQDIAQVVETAENILVKVILETSLLTEEEIVQASTVSLSAGASYIKTSTGFASGGATVEAISLMSQTIGDEIGIKASGGIGDFEKALSMVRAGATRIGSSRSIKIIGE
ncbi:deoxyribose-phosphate aldolase [bacterium]|nr:deoxyribose-phosphate aldolase [bacterium]